MQKRRMSTFERLTGGCLNRNERRKLARRVATADPSLSIINCNAAGIDVGNESHFVAVPPDRDPNPVREFGCWTAALKEMAQWLVDCRIDTVAMQSTGVYWIALYDVLEQHGIRVVLANAYHTKTVPGRKTDVQESQWLMKLHTYGLLRDSFRMPQQIECVRTIWRLRDRHVAEAARTVQHMQKALTKMNVQLANAISDISGMTGQAIIAAILRGERDPWVLAELRDGRIKATKEEIARSLEGNWREDIIFELQQAVDAYQFAHKQIGECDRKLQAYLATLPARTLESAEAVETSQPIEPKVKKRKYRKPAANAPQMDLRGELRRICGVDLTAIDGINIMGALTIVSEIGTDLSGFPDENHFASWLGLTGPKDISGGKPVRAKKRKVNNRVADVLRLGAAGLLNSDTWLGARARHLRRKAKTPAVAVKAMARQLAVLVYRLLTRGQSWVDRGAERFEQKQQQRDLAALSAQASARGFRLVPVSQIN
jgi:transposase